MNKYNNTVVLKYMAFILAMLVIFTNSSFRLGISSVYYAFVISFLVLISLMGNQKFKILNFSMLFVYLAGIASIIFNIIPSRFHSEQRFLMFICVTLLVGPFIGSKQFIFFRKRLFYYVSVLLILFSSLSYLGLATGIYRGATTISGGIRADFSGLFNHSMTLSPMAGLAVLACLYFYYATKNKKAKYLLLACIPLCFLSSVAAGSRSALMGLIAGLLFFFYKLYQKNMGRYIKTIFLFTMIGVLSFPLWEERTSFLKKKMDSAESQGSLTSSRDALWEQRIREFNYSPVIGVGFAAADFDFSDEWFEEDIVESGGGQVEPGSSWLAVLSMTGVLGFIPIFLLFLADIVFIFKNGYNRLWLSYIGGILIFFTVHMFAEGYIFAFGSLMFFFLWLSLGIIEISKVECRKQ